MASKTKKPTREGAADANRTGPRYDGHAIIEALRELNPGEVAAFIDEAFRRAEEQGNAEAADRKRKEEIDRSAHNRKMLVAAIRRQHEAEVADMERRHKEEREAKDGTTSRKLAGKLKDLAINHAPKGVRGARGLGDTQEEED